jgi:hypothetical protein
MSKRLTILFPVALLTACSTTAVTPALTTFSTAAETAAKSHLKLVETAQHKTEVQAARLRLLEKEGAAYQEISASDCLYVRPDVRVEPQSFDQSCTPKLVAADDKVIATYFDPPAVQNRAERLVDALPQDIDLMRDHEGIQLAKSLQSYAEALANLSASTAPQDISKGLSSTITAVGGLHSVVSSISTREGGTAPNPPDFSRAAGITSVLAREILETKRYQILKRVVTQADPFVRIASRQLAILTFDAERAKIEPVANELREASVSFEAGSAAGIARTERAIEALSKADQQAAFRQFDRLQQAHAAILTSFDAPRSTENLTAANTRINEFLDAVKSK